MVKWRRTGDFLALSNQTIFALVYCVLATTLLLPAVSHQLCAAAICFNWPLLQQSSGSESSTSLSFLKITTITWTKILCNSSYVHIFHFNKRGHLRGYLRTTQVFLLLVPLFRKSILAVRVFCNTDTEKGLESKLYTRLLVIEFWTEMQTQVFVCELALRGQPLFGEHLSSAGTELPTSWHQWLFFTKVLALFHFVFLLPLFLLSLSDISRWLGLLLSTPHPW